MHRALRFLIWLGCAASGAALAQPAPPPGCALHWRLTPQREATPPRVQVDLSFDAGPHGRTELLLPEGSEVAQRVAEGDPTLEPVAGRPLARSVVHRPGERVNLSFAIVPGEAAWARLLPRSLLFAGRALLPVPAGGGHWQMCLSLSGLGADDTLVAGPGQLDTTERLLRLQGSAALARDWIVAAGALQQAERSVDGQRWQVVLAAGTAPGPEAPAVADASAVPLGAVRRFWADGPAPDRWLMLLPAAADSPPRGLALPGALVLQWPAAAPLPGPQFDDTLLYTALQAWFRERFGPVAYEQRPDEALNAWFVNGFARFYAQRLRSAAGQPLGEQASALSALLQPGPGNPADAPWLPMRWHGALRAQGHLGLDAVLKRLLLPAAQARVTGPLSSPLATHRLQAALRPLLADAPRRDLQQLAERPPGAALAATWLTAQTLGPCFRFDAAAQQVLAAEAEASPACQGWQQGSTAGLGATARAAPKAGGKAAAKPRPAAKASGKAKKPARRTRR
ncbi:MAG: hypothetical protein HY855_20465 [Burkholderiales bacterium]|nr:hypothetical protein [Burkholderiales bacterium]